ncbi:extracellular calcium-sensing receptor-like [Protopterus annectens]|uniref:extracellular calcium-sensing receptor-like n=1 Tax=Protopterus annectens TaxID=7888 RepID=UPI001CFB0629|nr:extracellular calcium-sensing receptor-like [Protopterus annectens]
MTLMSYAMRREIIMNSEGWQADEAAVAAKKILCPLEKDKTKRPSQSKDVAVKRAINPKIKQLTPTFDTLAYQDLLAMVYATEEVNIKSKLLQNVSLGFLIYDTCSTEVTAIENSLALLSAQQTLSPNYVCQSESKISGTTGEFLSYVSQPIAELLGIFRFPQISHGSGAPLLSDKIRYPSFVRTIPNTYFQPYGLAQIIVHFSWTWIGILYADNEYIIQQSQQLKQELAMFGICVAFFEMLPASVPRTKVLVIADMIQKSTAKVIVLYVYEAQLSAVLEELVSRNITDRVWIGARSWMSRSFTSKQVIWKLLTGAVGFAMFSGRIPGFKEFLYNVHLNRYPDDIFIKIFWSNAFGCKWPSNKTNLNLAEQQTTDNSQMCTGNEKLTTLNPAVYPVDEFRYSYNMYNAMYSLVYALKNLRDCKTGEGSFVNGSCADSKDFRTWQFLHYVKNVHFKNSAGDEIFFDANGDIPVLWDVSNCVLNPKGYLQYIRVGYYTPYASPGKQLILNDSAIMWAKGMGKIPRSVCSESCSLGFRKATRQGEPVCCYDCVPCSEGEITNRTADSIDCLKCQDDHWTNAERDACVKKLVEFISYEEPLGSTLAVIAIILSTFPASVLWIFIKFRDTPIVKANNRGLSYILLIVLMLCFLCSLLFISPSNSISCLLRQVAFGILFSICVSSILAKTITVVIAFNATKPGNNLRRWVGTKTPVIIVLFSSAVQVCICAGWLATSPPFPENNMKYYKEKIVIECNEGSIGMFYCMLGYLGFLASVSFIVAFMARTLPDRFNEAKFITFSMLVFVSVWLSFIPAYLSTKGIYVVAVEIFAILSSTAGLLSCIFIPKCYIILLKPELNTKEGFRGKTT